MMKDKGGRRTKLNQVRHKLICSIVLYGGSYDLAIFCSNISRSTFYNWIARGQNEEFGIYAEFYRDLMESKRNAEYNPIITKLVNPKLLRLYR